MAVKVQVRTEAETKALERYQKEIDSLRKELLKGDKSVSDFTKEMRKLDAQQRSINKLMPESTTGMSKMKNMFAGFTITAGDVWRGLQAVASEAMSWATAGAEAQKATDTLRFAVEKEGIAWDSNAAAIDANIQKLSWLAAVDDEDLAVAQSKLIRSTGDLAESQRMLGLATDISAVTGIELGSVVKALSRAYDGNYSSLSKLGIAIDSTGDKTEVFDELYREFGGGAEYVSDNLVSDAERVSIAWGNLKESAGQAFGPWHAKNLTSMALALDLVSSETLTGAEKWDVYWEAYGGAVENLDVVKEALGYTTDGLLTMTDATYEAAQAQRDLTQAREDYLNIADSSEQADINLERATIRASDAQADLTEAVRIYGEGSPEAVDAALDVRQANLDLKEATEKAADAQGDLNEATANFKSANKQVIDKWVSQLKRIQDAADSTRRSIAGIETSATGHLSFPLPSYGTGTYATSPHLAVVGDEPEVIIPLGDEAAAAKYLPILYDSLGSDSGGSRYPATSSSVKSSAVTIAPGAISVQVVLKSGSEADAIQAADTFSDRLLSRLAMGV